METAIVSIICVALIVVGGMTMSQSFLSSVDSTAVGLSNVSQIDEKILRTNISVLGTSQPSSARVELSLRNSGQIKLNDFDKWDFIIQYTDGGGNYFVKWLPYTTGSPADNQWGVKGIYMDASGGDAEVFEPGILNPGEEIILRARVNPSVGEGTTNMVTVSTPSGVTASALFIRN
ncbi:MAG: hypothetical protein Q8O16_06940 [Dehalococcoidia bacterium]|nr:hypothetical protein [Dehalococcoidia bacterium]